jgi:hypothetical protein
MDTLGPAIVTLVSCWTLAIVQRMCRRLTQKNTWSELAEVYALMQPPPIPAWRKKAIRDMPATFNARAETIR